MFHLVRIPCSIALLASLAFAGDWTNLGGNAQRNGRVSEVGPASSGVLWSNTQDGSIISWAPFTFGNRAFTVRESSFPQNGGAANDAIVCYDLNTGQKLWNVTLPFNGNTSQEWIAWIAGVSNGKLYASRSSNGQARPLYALDVATGATVWTSIAQTQTFAYDGVVFAPDGDLLIGDLANVWRIDADTGTTVWQHVRARSVSGNCGVAQFGNAVYCDVVVGGGQAIDRLDLATGNFQYRSPTMSGFTEQNSPFVGPDGTVYLSRTQNNASVDFLYAFSDTGSALTSKWSKAVLWTTSHEFGCAADGGVYTFLPNMELVKLDAANGNVLASGGVLTDVSSPKTAVDSAGTVYVMNGFASSPLGLGRLWAFDGSLGAPLFTLNYQRPNQGGPALGQGGVLVMCDLGGVTAYGSNTPTVYCTAKLNSLSCTPSIGFSGTPSASSPLPFPITCLDVLNNKNGLCFYSHNGPASLPFQGGLLCVQPPIKRTSVQNSAGNPPPNDCSGAYAFDFNAHIQSGSDPLLVPGAQVHSQYWARDPQDVFTTSLSDALEFLIGL